MRNLDSGDAYVREELLDELRTTPRGAARAQPAVDAPDRRRGCSPSCSRGPTSSRRPPTGCSARSSRRCCCASADRAVHGRGRARCSTSSPSSSGTARSPPTSTPPGAPPRSVGPRRSPPACSSRRSPTTTARGWRSMPRMVSGEELASRFVESGPVLTLAERAAGDRDWAYGHVVVDEAQELSPMAWRAVARRCPSRSMTVVGDLAQTSNGAGARSWAEALDEVTRGVWRVEELTINYRTPARIARVADRVLAAMDRDVSAPRAVREGDHDPVDHLVDDLAAGRPRRSSAARRTAGSHGGGGAGRPRRDAAPRAARGRHGRRLPVRRARRRRRRDDCDAGQGARVRPRRRGRAGDRGRRGAERARRPLRRTHPRDVAARPRAHG